MDLFNDPNFRVLGMVLLVAVVSVLLVLLFARYEKKRRFWKYLIPVFLLLTGIFFFVVARTTTEVWGAIGYMLMAFIAWVSSVPGLITAIVLDVIKNKRNSGGPTMR